MVSPPVTNKLSQRVGVFTLVGLLAGSTDEVASWARQAKPTATSSRGYAGVHEVVKLVPPGLLFPRASKTAI